MKCLVVGPDNGLEFGWFLMRWQAKIRFLSKKYDKTFVITTPDREYIYRDFAEPYQNMNKYLAADMWRFRKCDVDYIQPNKQFCCSDGNDEFVKYRKVNIPVVNPRFNYTKYIVIHTRQKNDGREWSAAKWHEFINSLNEITDLLIVGIGLSGMVHQMATDNIQNTLRVLTRAVLAIGPSSGPMHLASLCGCPHLVWSDDKIWNLGVKKGTNRERYETVWNPFKTTAIVIDNHGWNPPVQIILDETEKWLKNVA